MPSVGAAAKPWTTGAAYRGVGFVRIPLHDLSCDVAARTTVRDDVADPTDSYDALRLALVDLEHTVAIRFPSLSPHSFAMQTRTPSHLLAPRRTPYTLRSTARARATTANSATANSDPDAHSVFDRWRERTSTT
jgi:hypothetical protein